MPMVHDAAQRGFTAQAQQYARSRPEYPKALEPWLAQELGIAPSMRVLDVGAGTGKFTRLLSSIGADVTALEPVAKMREELSLALPKVPVMDGTAEQLPLGDATVNVVTCAQAFHWFATTAALAQFHRVLVPGGRLGLVWNVRDESVDWVAHITRIITPYEGNAPRFHTGRWREAFDGRYFADERVATFEHHHTGSPDDVILGRFLSVSFIAALPQAEQDAVAAQLRDLIATHPALKGKDQVSFPYQTQAYAWSRS
ncbi:MULTISPECIES: class I SAM-dependent methyltransferase [unclassified Pseudomonas]|uniref:class I SAM-dependent methyltransferase n=1 Tax=unclassified Pseudomonas TaxID=196821 RepID=UPI000BD7B918|nr:MULTISPECIES: class I SAM-dependent methyltransferase [unclassified Pseudomonas]PVZ20295.1 methyltransferase family protein [Pseudomonas sp. URIL14HWK12:I12]PVZ27361.1 methyltransferase family protein [Pseudomonas sp. URIL14HWK12:I10]PVZ38250.1 methyltransferase family protein [Pseudomonas sp. URIL14HWK12:I11]SNZ04106.1 Methylase involved in ubiquinone/menaquinone biosynthesis [Pseudomonas sp. URIL14HWK12:I9]